MITFRCRCSHRFEVADDRAGESFQCPSCGLLVDVPTLEELAAMQEDGSYVLTDAAPTEIAPTFGDTPSIAARHDVKDRRLSLKSSSTSARRTMTCSRSKTSSSRASRSTRSTTR